jgi:hypothetical protein
LALKKFLKEADCYCEDIDTLRKIIEIEEAVAKLVEADKNRSPIKQVKKEIELTTNLTEKIETDYTKTNLEEHIEDLKSNLTLIGLVKQSISDHWFKCYAFGSPIVLIALYFVNGLINWGCFIILTIIFIYNMIHNYISFKKDLEKSEKEYNILMLPEWEKIISESDEKLKKDKFRVAELDFTTPEEIDHEINSARQR